MTKATLDSKTDRSVIERLADDMIQIPGRDFMLCKYPVTNRLWKAVMGWSPLATYLGEDCPVHNAIIYDANRFIARLNAQPEVKASGIVYRLPTVDEWDFACRAGSTGDYCRLADGTDITEATLVEVMEAPMWAAYSGRTSPVGRKKPNAFGLYDMIGNVAELVTAEKGKTDVWFSCGGSYLCNPDCYKVGCHIEKDEGEFCGFRLAGEKKSTATPQCPEDTDMTTDDIDMTIEDADLRGDQCVDRLKKDPSFADKCDWSRLSSWDWMNLLCSHPEYADHCDWSELDYDTVVESCLLDDQPQLAVKCDWSRFSRSQKAELLLEHPEFGQYTGRRQLIVELGCGQFVELGRKVIPLDDDDEEPVEDAKVSSRDKRRLYAVMDEGGIVHALSVRVFLGGKIVFEHNVSPEDACGVTFDDCGDLFDIAPPKNGRWLYGAECNDPTSITPWQVDVPARFKFDPSKLRIPYCRARISAFPETALLVAPEEIRYGRRRPDTSGEDGDFVIDHKYDDMPDRTTTQSFWLETEDGPEEYDGPWAEDDGDGGFFDEAFHFVTVEHVE